MAMRWLPVLALVACSSTPPPPPSRVPAAIIDAVPTKDVDVLFLIDDSISLDMETNLKDAYPAFFNVLNENGGFPNVHIGVATSDLGTSAVADPNPGPNIGAGPPDYCWGRGKSGNLQTNGSTVVNGSFIADVKNADGTRTTNYSGALIDAFDGLASVGIDGCGFEQTLEGIQRTLDNNPANAGFLRPDANLAIVVVSDEDDCSLEHTSLIDPNNSEVGPLQSFRCTHYGITCDVGGTTPEEMNTPGHKELCHSNDDSTYLTHVADHVAFLKSLKADPSMVMVGTVVGTPAPVDVEMRPAIGTTTPIPALAHSCNYTDANNQLVVADPAVRIDELANSFERHVTGSACQSDLSPPMVAIARQIQSMTGSTCLVRDIAMPADCVVTDDAGPVADYTLATDPTMCPDGQHLRFVRAGTATGKTVVSCTAPQ